MSIGPHRALALTARLSFVEALMRGFEAMVQACLEGARVQATQLGDPALAMKRRDLVLDLGKLAAIWRADMDKALNEALRDLRVGRAVGLKPATSAAGQGDLGQLSARVCGLSARVCGLSARVCGLSASK